jgi:hypothetical protein
MRGGIRIRLRGREFTFQGDREVHLGRDPSIDVYSDNPLVSRHHAVLRPHEESWVLEDTGSKRGTFVDGRRITRLVLSDPSTTVWLAEPGEGQVLLLLPEGAGAAATPTGIFISYRRDDAAGYAGWLYERLSSHFGEEQLFRDIDTVDPGTDFVGRIERAVGSCKVMLVIIGRSWLEARDSDGRRRLDNPQDWVTLEIAAALQRNIRVIPVLVEGATMPRPESLPSSIQELAFRNALEMTDNRWNHDVSRLITAIEKAIGTSTPLPDETEATPTPREERRSAPSPKSGPGGKPAVAPAWWLLPFFFGLVGGFAAWLATHEVDRARARNLLLFGLGMTVVWLLVSQL